MRSYATFAALCAVNLCLFQSGSASARVHKAHHHQSHHQQHQHAHKQAAALCTQTVTTGDAAVGINIVSDATCATGGVGCIDTICRFCKTKNTPQSSHLVGCETVGWTAAPTTAPPVATTSAPVTSAPIVTISPSDAQCATSQGDYAAGIQGIYDESCAAGGLGCASDVCRHCKWKSTSLSSHLLDCGSYTKAPVVTSAPVVTTAAPPAATPTPPDVTPTDPDTFAPSSVDVDTECAWAVSEGDHAVGIQLVGDATCANGGTGCYQDVCRYCKYTETPQSKHLTSCLDLGYDFSGTYDPNVDDGGDAEPPASTPTPQDVTGAPPSPGAATDCPFKISEGDAAVGIQLVGDATCEHGGLGCFENVCRYCMTWETPQSKHLTACADLGYPFDDSTFAPTGGDDETPAPTDEVTPEPTTAAPLPSTGCPFAITEGDYSVGIHLVGDASCATGGLGCFEDVCRYCKFHSTPASSHLLSCSDLGYDFGWDEVTTAPTTAPTAEPTAPPAPIKETGCPYPVTEGDFSVGIQLVADATCAAGGLGCYEAMCRYCKFAETPQSKHFTACADLGYSFTEEPTFKPVDNGDDETSAPTTPPTVPPPIAETGCPYPITSGDYAVGIHLVGDATCVDGGVGCYETVCRYCQYKTTPQSGHLWSCKDLGYNFGVDEETPAPTTATPTAPPPPIEETGCPYPVTEGDFAVGIQLVVDATCAAGGVGCYEGMCRYCKFEEFAESKHLIACSDLGYSFTTAPTFAPADTSEDGSDAGDQIPHTPAPTTEAPAPDTDGSADTEAPATEAPATDAPAPTAAPTMAPIDTKCSFAVSDGDKAVGIQLVGDAACASGGLGCFADVCRFCKVRSTAQSAHLLACIDLGFDFGGSAAGPEPTSAPTAPPTPIEETGCPYPVSEGDFAVGIQLVGDATCANGGMGCYEGICRYCKFAESAQASHLTACSDLGYSFTTAPTFAPTDIDETPAPTTAAPEPTPIPETGCPYPVSMGDYNVGIQLVGDATCVDGGNGCYENVCRYCQYTSSPQSAHMVLCSDLGYTFGSSSTPEPVTDAPSVGPVPTTCPLAVSAGDYSIGIQLVTDPTCVNGGLGCVAEVCRFCKFHETPGSAHLLDCSLYATTSEPDHTTSPDSTPAPPTPTCEFTASEGDVLVGIQVIPDETCVNGGVGCFHDVCRYCKVFETEKSSHLGDCSLYTSIDVTDITDAPTTEAPIVTEPPVDVCSAAVAEGDKLVGVDMFTDASCPSGVGCVDKTSCRFCKRWETPASSHMIWCPSAGSTSAPAPVDTSAPAPVDTSAPAPVDDTSAPAPVVTAAPSAGDACSATVSIGDKNVGVDMFTDPSCPSGVGCIDKTSCRFCKRWDSAASSHMVPCPTGDAPAPAPGPVDPAPGPVDPAPAPAPGPVDPAPAPAPAGTDACSAMVSVGDKNVGVDMFTDASCPSGVGCIDKTSCRFCKRWDSAASSHMVPCPTGDAPAPAPGPVDPVPGPVDPVPAPAPAPAVGDACSATVSIGDKNVGIDMFTDASCPSGVGCVDKTSCRFCKHWDTPASQHMTPCPTGDAPAPGTVAPPADVATPTPDMTIESPAVANGCTQSVSDGDAEAGIDIITDWSCLTDVDGLGCIDKSSCRLCKRWDSDASKHLGWCPTADSPPQDEAPPQDEPAAPLTEEECAAAVTEELYAGGVGTIFDPTCDGGVSDQTGCFPQGSCRYCKVSEGELSSAYYECEAYTIRLRLAKARKVHSIHKSVKSGKVAKPQAAPFKLAAKSAKSVSTKDELDELLKDKTFKWALAGAACVGVAAVVALLAMGVKRVATRSSRSKSLDEEEAVADDEALEAVVEAEAESVVTAEV